VTQVCDTITGGTVLEINSTIITGGIILSTPSLPDITELSGVTNPDGGEVIYRLRTSLDGINFTNWTEWLDYTESYQFDPTLGSLQKYLEYEISMTGTSSFETPVIDGGVDLSYYKPREFVIFFQPVSVNMNDDEYISSIHITSETDTPEDSVIEYLMTQSDSLIPEEYYNVYPDEHTIIPTRFNELIESTDLKTYTAVNGGWTKNETSVVMRILKNETQGTVVPESEYAINNNTGTVTFLSPQDASSVLFIDLFFASSFRIAAKVTNFSKDSATIHHIGVMYNVSKRIPMASNGTIINTPISKRIPE
jgi:hypothetical protein